MCNVLTLTTVEQSMLQSDSLLLAASSPVEKKVMYLHMFAHLFGGNLFIGTVFTLIKGITELNESRYFTSIPAAFYKRQGIVLILARYHWCIAIL